MHVYIYIFIEVFWKINICLTYTFQINQLLGSFSSCLTTNAANLSWWYLSAGTHSQKYIMFEGCCYPNPKNPTWTVLSPYPFNPLAVWIQSTRSTEVQLGNWCTIGDIVPGTLKAGQGWARHRENTRKRQLRAHMHGTGPRSGSRQGCSMMQPESMGSATQASCGTRMQWIYWNYIELCIYRIIWTGRKSSAQYVQPSHTKRHITSI